MRESWERMLFPRVSARALGACRAAFYGLAFLLFLPMDFAGLSASHESVWRPFSFFHLTGSPDLSEEGARMLGAVWKASLAASALGFVSPLALPLAAALGTFLLGIRSGFGQPIHNHCFFLLTAWVLALAPCSHRVSLDARLFSRRGGEPPPGAYGWPFRLIQLLFVIGFFSAGLSKLLNTGLAWASAPTMKAILDYAHETYRGAVISEAQLWANRSLAENPFLMAVAASLALAAELLSPLAFFFRRAAWVLVPALLAMQAGIWLALYLDWRPMMICYLFWLAREGGRAP